MPRARSRDSLKREWKPENRMVSFDTEKTGLLLASAMEQISEAIIITDAQGRIAYSNRAFEDITGITKTELTGRRVTALRHHKCGAAFYRAFKSSNDKDGTWLERIVSVKQNGDPYEADASISPVKNRQAQKTHSILVSRDVTHEKRLERQLIQAQKMEAIGTLTGGIAHDFNNILSAMIGYVELAQLDMPQNDPVRQLLGQVLKAGQRAKELIRQIMSFSRPTEPLKTPVQMNLLAHETIELLRACVPPMITIREQIEVNDLTILADATQIHQVIMNLCTNAVQAMEGEDGVLEIELKRTRLSSGDISETPDLRSGDYIELIVRDTGQGISTVIMDRLFDPFFTTKGREKGSGMGLSIVLSIVKSHKGAVRVSSKPGQGSSFHVFLPVADRNIEKSKRPKDELIRGDACVMMVDDEKLLVDIGRRSLERLGYRVVPLTDPVQALKMFQEDPTRFDLIITDLSMPKMDGMLLAEELRRIRPDIPIILISGYSEPKISRKAELIGIDAVHSKPLLGSELVKTVQRVLK